MDYISIGYIYKILLHLRLREHLRKEGRNIVRAKGSGSSLSDWVSANARSYASNSHHDLNKDNSRHAEVVKGKILNPIQRTTGNEEIQRVEKIIFFRAEDPIPNDQPRNHKKV